MPRATAHSFCRAVKHTSISSTRPEGQAERQTTELHLKKSPLLALRVSRGLNNTLAHSLLRLSLSDPLVQFEVTSLHSLGCNFWQTCSFWKAVGQTSGQKTTCPFQNHQQVTGLRSASCRHGTLQFAASQQVRLNTESPERTCCDHIVSMSACAVKSHKLRQGLQASSLQFALAVTLRPCTPMHSRCDQGRCLERK